MKDGKDLSCFGWGEYYERRAKIFDDPLVASEYVTPGGRLDKELVRKMAAFVLESLAPAPGDSFLDVGCGCGVMLDNLRKAGMCIDSVQGVDVSPAMIEKARLVVPQASFQVMEAADIGKLGVFDRILLWGVIHYLDRKEYADQVVGKVVASLAKGGKALIGWVPDSSKKEKYIAWRKSLPHIENNIRIQRADSLVWLWFTRNEFKALESECPVSVRILDHRIIATDLSEFFFSVLLERTN